MAETRGFASGAKPVSGFGSGPGSAPGVSGGGVYLDGYRQEDSKGATWCWAAVAVSVAAYLRKAPSPMTQCQVVKAALAKRGLIGQATDCCDWAGAEVPPPACDLPGPVEEALTLLHHCGNWHACRATIKAIKAQIDQGRPIVALILWGGCCTDNRQHTIDKAKAEANLHANAKPARHFVAVTGYHQTANAFMLRIDDPNPDRSTTEVAYEDFSHSYVQLGCWEWTFPTIPA